MNDPLTLTPAQIVDEVCAAYSVPCLDEINLPIRSMLAEAIKRAEERELYIVQAEDGDVVDVTWSRAHADRLTADDPDVPNRSLVTETAWYGKEGA